MSNVKEFTRGYIIGLMTGVIATTVMILSIQSLTAQTISINPVLLTSQQAVISIDYSGTPTTVAALNFKCSYDASLLQFDSVVPLHPFDTVGIWVPTQPGSTSGVFAGFWYNGPMDTIWIIEKPMFLVYFSVIAEGCSPLHWMTPPTDWCEIGDIGANVVPTTWVNNTICVITTSVSSAEYPQTVRSGERFTLLGQYTSSGGYLINNGRIYSQSKNR